MFVFICLLFLQDVYSREIIRPVDLKPCNIKAGLRWVQLMGLDNDPSLVDLGVTPGCEKHVQKYLTAVNESARKQQRGNVFDFEYVGLVLQCFDGI